MNWLLGIALAVIAFAYVTAESQPRNAAPNDQIGRYRLTTGFVPDGRIYLLDTATGKHWSRTSGGRWRKEINPVGLNGNAAEELTRLELPEGGAELTVIQREGKAIPGSDDRILIRLGDITEGQVLVTIVDEEGNVIRDTISLEQGENTEFTLRDQVYVVEVKELRNVLIGSDFAVFKVSRRESQ